MNKQQRTEIAFNNSDDLLEEKRMREYEAKKEREKTASGESPKEQGTLKEVFGIFKRSTDGC